MAFAVLPVGSVLKVSDCVNVAESDTSTKCCFGLPKKDLVVAKKSKDHCKCLSCRKCKVVSK